MEQNVSISHIHIHSCSVNRNNFWKRTAIKAQQVLKILVSNATSAMFQNKKLKRNATSAIAEIAEVARCSSTVIALCPPLLGYNYSR